MPSPVLKTSPMPETLPMPKTLPMSKTLHARWTDIATLAARRGEWQALAEAAVEPNPFYGPDFLIASENHLQPRQSTRCLIVEEGGPGGRLCALFPLQRPLLAHGLLGQAWCLHATPYTCLTTPLVASDCAEDAIDAALRFLACQPGPSSLFLSLTAEQRPFAKMLQEAIGKHPMRLERLNPLARAAIETGLDTARYRAGWSKSQTKNHARLKRRLEEAGTLEIEHLPGDSPEAPAMLEAFLALEARGWKGASGTALATNPATLAFTRDAFFGPERGARFYEVLRLDNRPIAVHLNLVAGGTAYSLKTTYDPDFARLGPSRFLDGEAIRLAAEGGRFTRMDSCAGPGHPMEASWLEREPIAGWLVELPGRRPSPLFGLTAARIRLAAKLSAWRNPKGYTTRRG